MTAPRIKAIETRYAGCRFRSRTEARWAVFFDALGVDWEYEREGFELPSGRYLPDFWLPKQECWVEIKGVHPTPREQRLAYELAVGTKQEVNLFFGAPVMPNLEILTNRTKSGLWYSRNVGFDPNDEWDCSWWSRCIVCGEIGISEYGSEPCIQHDRDLAAPYRMKMAEAYEQARSARFGV